jgi:hypothetical protein
MHIKNFLGAAFIASNLAACASFDLSRDPEPLPVERAANACGQWLAAIDGLVARAGVNDAAAFRIPGFPYLRVDRFTASFARQAPDDDALFAAWTRAARALDREGRAVELQNLPPAALLDIDAGTIEAAMARTDSCANQSMALELGQPALRKLVTANARVPDDYIDLNRVVGLYPLVQPFFATGVARWHHEAVNAFRDYAKVGQPKTPATRYAPHAGSPLSQKEVAALLAHAPRDSLGRVLPGPVELDRLFETFAPVFEVESGGEFDAIGALAWRDEQIPSVDISRPVVYRRIAYTRYGREVLPQLVYTGWFPERPRDSAVDVLAGKLDGIVFRVTLATDGSPLVFDSIHPCGCYHMFFPSARVRELPSPRPGDEWSFVPAIAPSIEEAQRIVLHLQSRTHYLTGISAGTNGTGTSYELYDDDSLRSLQLPDGGRRSIYAPDGLVKGSERPERLLFWPMGVPSAGTMRQWGHNATAFLGRRHFDDADLIERRFAPAQ